MSRRRSSPRPLSEAVADALKDRKFSARLMADFMRPTPLDAAVERLVMRGPPVS